jgi:hypothetical protein
MRRNRAGEVQEPMQAQAVVKRYFFGAIPFALFFGSVKVIINFLTHDFPSLLNFNAVKCEETFTALKDVCKESIVSICGNLTKVN